MVYTAGCTDPSYTSSQCPSKCHLAGKVHDEYRCDVVLTIMFDLEDAYWIGHSYCNGTSNQWSCCSNHIGDPTNKRDFPFNNKEPCWCPDENAQIAFTAPSVIPSVARLELAHPGSISYFPDHTPSAATGDTSKTTGTGTTVSDKGSPASSPTGPGEKTQFISGGSTKSQSPASNTASVLGGDSRIQTAQPGSADSSSLPSSSPSLRPLSTNAKIGIGVGVGLGTLLLLAAFCLLFIRHRNHRDYSSPPIEKKIRPKSFGSFAATSTSNQEIKSPVWSGHQSELPADENAVISPMSPSSSSAAEVEGTTPRESLISQSSRPSPPQLSQQWYDANGYRQYVPYNPSHVRGPNMPSIHEMPG